MLRSLYTAATGMSAQQKQIDVVSNNIANVNTVGFKKSRVEFADLFYQVMKYAGTSTSATTLHPSGIEVGLGVRTTAITKVFETGSYKQTSPDNFDVAIQGNGFFQIQLPDGTTAYTRNGQYTRDSEGNIVNADGYFLLPQMTIPEGAVNLSIAQDGTVSVQLAGETDETQIGQIELVNFINPAGLHSMGDNLYLETGSSGAPVAGVAGQDGLGVIRHGFVEMSNVQLVEEMTDLITGQRAYEAGSKAITTSDEMLAIVNQLKR
ncbi:flagellar basal-body rod protein FlgG [Campylobacter troglodytis]|uniref:flagellar basal-body rod protein FlgG n=1 Tax=Campylobacter troglodytis TaxID=654363 RepID=UPI001158FF5E|nr:flagellar basal-body rod protein FlgG [Campylobacter troglodytis]TQR58150.1 flagellar basal-body rod protein FlgG [Campylobacter troglodytis]